jgi:hypothetical protein
MSTEQTIPTYNIMDIPLDPEAKSSKNIIKQPPHIDWTREHESILIEWADKAMCFRWLHSQEHTVYARKLMWFTIPVIVMSTVTGTANFAQERLPVNLRSYAAMSIGAVNIFAGVLTTIQQFLKVSELNEAHRVASIAWDKFYRNTKVELSKTPLERVPVVQLLKSSKEEYDRLMETSPIISDTIVKKFKATFNGGKAKKSEEDTSASKKDREIFAKNRAFNEVYKPEICGTMMSTAKSVYKHPELLETADQKHTVTAIELAKRAIALKQKQDKIEQIIIKWQDKYKNTPSAQDILNELEDNTAIQFIENYLEEEHRRSVSLSEGDQRV